MASKPYPPNSVLACDLVDLAAQTGLDRAALADLDVEEVVALNMEVTGGAGDGPAPEPVDRHLPGLRNGGRRLAANCGGSGSSNADDVEGYVANAGVVTREPDANAKPEDDRRPTKSSAPMARPTARTEAMLSAPDASASADDGGDDWTEYVPNAGVVMRPPDGDDDRE